MDIEVTDEEQELVADHLLEYYAWIIGHGGTHPDKLLSYPHTVEQRKLLLRRMDDLNVILGHLNSLRPVLAQASADE